VQEVLIQHARRVLLASIVANSGIAVPAGIMMAAKRVDVESFILVGGWSLTFGKYCKAPDYEERCCELQGEDVFCRGACA